MLRVIKEDTIVNDCLGSNLEKKRDKIDSNQGPDLKVPSSILHYKVKKMSTIVPASNDPFPFYNGAPAVSSFHPFLFRRICEIEAWLQ